MARDIRIATHPGVVTGIKKNNVEVTIESVSACASCSAHAHCGFAESKSKTIEIPTSEWTQYSIGDTVEVHIDESKGMLAVWIAYLLPALLLLADIIVFSIVGLPEWAVVTSAFFILGLYTVFIYLRRKHIEARFTLSIAHLDPHHTVCSFSE